MAKKKLKKFRGSKTHGHGGKKKRRGAGNRGGRGLAGSGKRGDQKKFSLWNLPRGKYGFSSKTKPKNIVNIAYIEEHFERLLNQRLISKENDYYIINLEEMGFDKLLSSGNPTKKFKLIVKEASKAAINKIRSAGGEVILK